MLTYADRAARILFAGVQRSYLQKKTSAEAEVRAVEQKGSFLFFVFADRGRLEVDRFSNAGEQLVGFALFIERLL